jgi:two-component system chemotaxis sensor kinase CheA
MNLIGELVVAKNGLPYVARRAELQYGVREVAREIKDQYAVLHRITEELHEAIMQVREGITRVQREEEKTVLADFSQQFGKLVALGEEYLTLGQDHTATLERMTSSNQRFAHLTMDLLGKIQFQDVMRQKAEQVIHTLARMEAQAAALVEYINNPEKALTAEELSLTTEGMVKDYVMEEQRTIHYETTDQVEKIGKVAAEALPKVELF